jgi:hypothetical protein
MGTTQVSSGKSLFFLLATIFVLASCVAVPSEPAEPVIQDPGPQTEAVIAAEEPPHSDVATEQAVGPVPEPVPVPEPATEPVPEPDPEPPVVVFDPATVSAEVKEMTFTDVKRLIQNLNTVIQTRNYDLWTTNLTDDYLEYWSDPETLARLSESPVLRRQNITLTTLRDYFIHVVYPSRQNDRVDDIEFIGETRIKAIIINPKGERLVLYNLEKIGDTWKIANWR